MLLDYYYCNMNSHNVNVHTICKREFIFPKSWTDPFCGKKFLQRNEKEKSISWNLPPSSKIEWSAPYLKKKKKDHPTEVALLVHDGSSPSICFPSAYSILKTLKRSEPMANWRGLARRVGFTRKILVLCCWLSKLSLKPVVFSKLQRYKTT